MGPCNVNRLFDRLLDRVRGGRSSLDARRLVGAGLIVLALAALVAYLAGAFDSKGARHFGATFAPLRAEGLPGGRSPTSPGGGDSPTGRRTRDAAAHESPILTALDNYWEDIESHAYPAAFGFYSPGAINLTEAEFIAEQQRAGVKSARFAGTVTASTKELDRPNTSYATVAISSLVTHDAQHGCRRWSGSYTMLLEENGAWHIQHAALGVRPC